MCRQKTAVSSSLQVRIRIEAKACDELEAWQEIDEFETAGTQLRSGQPQLFDSCGKEASRCRKNHLSSFAVEKDWQKWMPNKRAVI
jgi:hypothetical protein